MKTFKFLVIVFLLLFQPLKAHDMHAGSKGIREWHLVKSSKPLLGALLWIKDQQIAIELPNASIQVLDFNQLSQTDMTFVKQRAMTIANLNKYNTAPVVEASKCNTLMDHSMLWIFITVALVFCLLYYKQLMSQQSAIAFMGVVLLALIFGFRTAVNKAHSTSNPLAIDSAFTPFKATLNTHWDNTYFYVESNGIPTTHNMMVGITGWQQQVPIPQCYIGSNPWSIPLNPVIATNPVPVNQSHFLRGAVAVAVNGIAIFNPYTNTGVDAFLDGQLDQWGGHCGRADDYHYHIAPLHLYSTVAMTKPIAFALDGFAIYGAQEPDGSAMQTLDANHGHYGSNGVYHYHGTSSAPYMIGKMVGQVTEDTTLQIVPQAAAKPIRPAGTPLKGAVITNFANKGATGYVLTYILNNQTYQVDYSWNANGQYTFNFINPTGTTTSNYNGFKPCPISNNVSLSPDQLLNAVQVFPNPCLDILHCLWSSQLQVYKMTLFNHQGQSVWQSYSALNELSMKSFAAGQYTLLLETNQGKLQYPISKF